jgi:RNA polymerase sigma factor (sigma-70 family)
VNTHQYQHMTDAELLDNFYTDRNNEWLGVLLQRYTLLLLGVCMKYLKNEEEAKDGVQQVFLKTIAELHKYKVDYFKSWIYMVAKNHCLMKLRDRQGRNAASLNEESLLIEEVSVPFQQHIEKDKMLDTMTATLQELNGEQKQCVTLFYLDKKSYQEIAEHTGFSMLQVKSHIQNGKRNLRLLIERRLSNK